jgi:hypothetical protein
MTNELPALNPLKWSDYEALLTAGVDKRFLAHLYIQRSIGADDIRIEGGKWVRRFMGDRAIIIPTDDDYVAFRMDSPRGFWRMTGTAVLLGHDSLEHAVHFQQPLMVHESPLDWLKSGCDGIVILSWQHYWPAYLSDVRTLRTVNPAFGRRLRDGLKHPLPIPDIQVAA